MNLPDTFRLGGGADGDANIKVLTGDGHDPEYIAAGGMPDAEKSGWTPLATEPDGTVAGSILREAAAIVDGARNQQHGDKERSFVAIAKMWSAYLAARKDPSGPVRPHDVAQMMVLMKQQRAEWGTAIRDHFTDGAGYSAIAGELAPSSKET